MINDKYSLPFYYDFTKLVNYYLKIFHYDINFINCINFGLVPNEIQFPFHRTKLLQLYD